MVLDSSLSQPAASSARDKPFRLLDLPQEVQDSVYSQAFHIFDLELRTTSRADTFKIRGLPRGAKALQLVCHKIARDTQQVLQQKYSGLLKLSGRQEFSLVALRKLSRSSSMIWILQSSTILRVLYHTFLASSTLYRQEALSLSPWSSVLDHLSNVEILLVVTVVEASTLNLDKASLPEDQARRERMIQIQVENWVNAQRSIVDLSHLLELDLLGLYLLARRLSDNRRACRVHFERVTVVKHEDVTYAEAVSCDTKKLETVY